MIVVGVDPGSAKCGVAVVDGGSREVRLRRIVAVADAPALCAELLGGGGVLALGSGTQSGRLAEALRARGLQPHAVDERNSTLEARKRYFAANPPGGWRRFVPRGLLTPPVPVDDWAAVVIAERYLAAAGEQELQSR